MIEIRENYKELYDKILHDNNAKVISYGISDSYVEHWTEINSLIEYLANYYDENGVDFQIRTRKHAVILEDKSERGIKLEDLAFGSSKSREQTTKIGEKGEGFKLGALPIVRNNKKLLIETVGHTIIFYFDYDRNLKSKVLKSKVVKNNRKQGTVSYLETTKLKEAEEKFLFLNKGLTKVDDFLYEGENNYIFVNTYASQKIASYFSYAINVKQKVNRDRSMVGDVEHVVALKLFSSKNKVMIKKWLSKLSDTFFEQSFEYRVLFYFMHNKHRKDFKNLDLSLWEESAKEMNLHTISDSGSSRVKRLDVLYPDYYFVYPQNWLLRSFSEYILKNNVSVDIFSIGKIVEEKFVIPVEDFSTYRNEPDTFQLSSLVNNLNDLKLLKKVEKKGNLISFNLRNIDKLDLVEGKIKGYKKLYRRQIFGMLSSLGVIIKNNNLINWNISIDSTDDVVRVFTISGIPSKFQIEIKDSEVSKELDKDIKFMNKKNILKDKIYQLPTKQYIISNDIVQEEIDGLFSYDEFILKYNHYLDTFMTSTKVVKEILKSVKNNELEDMKFELSIIKKALLEHKQNTGFYTILDKKSIQKVWNKHFVDLFGIRSYISTSYSNDEKLRYNDYEVITMPEEIKDLFTTFDIRTKPTVFAPTSAVKGTIQKPMLVEFEEFQTTPYYKVFESIALLNNVLQEIYLIFSDNQKDTRRRFIGELLPYYTDNNRIIKDNYRYYRMTKSDYKKIIREYCFKVYNQTFLVEFNKDTTRGMQSSQNIFLEKDFEMGTFFHEYIHAATGLEDINIEFEKMLSFIGVVSYEQKLKLETREVKRLYNMYLKYN